MQMKYRRSAGKKVRLCTTISLLLSSAALSGCALKSGAGPSTSAINRADGAMLAATNIRVVDVNEEVARRLFTESRPLLFSDTIGDGAPIGSVIGKGDILDVAIWEAPPAVLFGAAGSDPRLLSSGSAARSVSLPEQGVDTEGRIDIPFIGRVRAAGRSPSDVSREIVTRLAGKAHQPQAIVRIVRNTSMNATVIGDVNRSDRVLLTPKGERVLDALASAGGVKSPINKTLIQVTRENRVATLPLETVIKDPRQNIRLQPDDVVTALYQTYSFTALGATGTNAEIPFEATGITLAQALGRAGGLQDHRADMRGAFLFRLENPSAFGSALPENTPTTPDGRIPVIYRIDLKNPAIFFAAQSFPIHDKDVIYVSNAPLAEFQKFVNIVSSLVYPIVAIENSTNNN